ncbi:MAG: HlyD family efflux transporter periplasmic adaptor subunit, partial [Ruminococcaceae bacterium]|nr:HlyD family efflux transporter periplasmic adaptor subunit [Oscillospiraceae bacterium]
MSEVVTAQAAPAAPKKAMHPKKKKFLKTGIIAAVIAGVIGAGGYGFYNFLYGEEDTSSVFSEFAYVGSIQSKVSGSGTAMAKESTAITLSQGGTVQEVYVTAGQIVSAGQPLYSIYSQAAQDEVDNAQKRVDDLSEQLNQLYEDMNNLTVRAPFAGKLQNVQEFELEEQVGTGATVATLVNDRQLKLSLYFSYAYENDINVGQKVNVSVPVVMGTFTGRVDKIHKVSYISPEGGVHFEAVIVFDNPGTLTAGMDASASLTAADGSAIYPYENAQLEFYDTRTITAKTSGPVEGMGNLLNHANVEAGEALLYLGSSTLDDDIRAKQTELEEATIKLQEAVESLGNFNAVAPIDGTVTSCTLTEGAEVKAGDTVLIISNNTTMVVTIQVDNTNISFIKPGDFVDLDWNGMLYQG